MGSNGGVELLCYLIQSYAYHRVLFLQPYVQMSSVIKMGILGIFCCHTHSIMHVFLRITY